METERPVYTTVRRILSTLERDKAVDEKQLVMHWADRLFEMIRDHRGELRIEMRVHTEPTPSLLERAVADRDARPWRYYLLTYDELKKFTEKVADERDALKTQLEVAPARAAEPQDDNQHFYHD